MAQIGANELKAGVKVEIDKQPFLIVGSEFIKPGKGQAFTRVKIKNLLNGKVIERTYKSNEKLDTADVNETKMRLLYTDDTEAVFMDDISYEQISILLEKIEDVRPYLLDDTMYDIIFYKEAPISVLPPNFLEMKIVETAPGVRGDTASGRVLKPCVTSTGAKIQIPIFVEEGEIIKIDTRTGEYVSRAGK
jgi:elongation factor P